MPDPLVPSSNALRRLAGITAPVGPRAYAATGFGLLAFKYGIDSLVVYATAGHGLSPLAYLLPLAQLRGEALAGVPDAALLFLLLWTLPFAWIGASQTCRRARDAGLPALAGLLFFVPFVNYLVMLGLCLAPSRPGRAAPPAALEGEARLAWSALTGVGAGAAVGLGMLGLSVFALGEYGAALFVGTPFVMGAIAGWLFNLRRPQGLAANALLTGLSVAIAEGALLLFALEGVLCLAMAAPITAVLAGLGVLLGRALAAARQPRALLGQVLVLPVLAVVEPPPAPAPIVVESAIDIAAPPEAVWRNVVAFGEITGEPAVYFRLGIACPLRARIEGEGAGAVRRCEFTTGAFVEPIHTWDPPRRLGFDVTSQPPTMAELSPYDRVYAPHLDGVLRSRRGEFELQPLPGGGTRLTGRTWYTLEMAPAAYWRLWSDPLIHAIHLRVLRHVQALSEAGTSAAPEPRR